MGTVGLTLILESEKAKLKFKLVSISMTWLESKPHSTFIFNKMIFFVSDILHYPMHYPIYIITN